MEPLMKADIFFFVTTIAVGACSILGAVALWYLIGILRDIRRATAKLESEIDAISDNADALYHTIRESFLFGLLFGKKKRK
jgi:hypothetical protein